MKTIIEGWCAEDQEIPKVESMRSPDSCERGTISATVSKIPRKLIPNFFIACTSDSEKEKKGRNKRNKNSWGTNSQL